MAQTFSLLTPVSYIRFGNSISNLFFFFDLKTKANKKFLPESEH